MSDELDLRERLKTSLDREIKDLEIRKSNLESQIHSLNIKLEGDRKVLKQEVELKYVDKENEIRERHIRLNEKEDSLELKENKLKDRQKFIEKEEIKIGQYEEDKKQLQIERHNFALYKDKMQKDLDIKIEKAAIAEGRLQEIDNREMQIKALDKQLKKKQEILDQQIGRINEMQKHLDLMRNQVFINEDKKEIDNGDIRNIPETSVEGFGQKKEFIRDGDSVS